MCIKPGQPRTRNLHTFTLPCLENIKNEITVTHPCARAHTHTHTHTHTHSHSHKHTHARTHTQKPKTSSQICPPSHSEPIGKPVQNQTNQATPCSDISALSKMNISVVLTAGWRCVSSAECSPRSPYCMLFSSVNNGDDDYQEKGKLIKKQLSSHLFISFLSRHCPVFISVRSLMTILSNR